MARGRIYRGIALFDEAGNRVPDPFLEIEQELWDAETSRLTLFFHPGRIKRGLVPNRERGLALKPGQRYRLVIDRQLRDASGNSMLRDFEKEIRVLPVDRKSPDIDQWRLQAPHAGERGPLQLTFDEPLDEALLQRMLPVIDEQGRRVPGQITVTQGERQWSFRPELPWREGRYRIEANPRLEDRAGNQLTRLFERAIQTDQPQTDDQALVLTFHITAKKP